MQIGKGTSPMSPRLYHRSKAVLITFQHTIWTRKHHDSFLYHGCITTPYYEHLINSTNMFFEPSSRRFSTTGLLPKRPKRDNEIHVVRQHKTKQVKVLVTTENTGIAKTSHNYTKQHGNYLSWQGSNLHDRSPEPKSGMSANSITPASLLIIVFTVCSCNLNNESIITLSFRRHFRIYFVFWRKTKHYIKFQASL